MVPGNTHPNSLWLARNQRFFATLNLRAKPGLHWICAYTQLGPKITPDRSGREKEFFSRKKSFPSMATLPLGTYTQATQNIPASPGVTLGRFFGVGSLAPLQPALYCSTVQSQPRRALLGARRTLLGLQKGRPGGPHGPPGAPKGPPAQCVYHFHLGNHAEIQRVESEDVLGGPKGPPGAPKGRPGAPKGRPAAPQGRPAQCIYLSPRA